MRFSKYEAAGNDFILVDGRSKEIHLSPEAVRSFCMRRSGIGADGIIMALPSAKADFRMKIWNADGSEAEMCGNGIRALFLFLHQLGATQSEAIEVETLAGIKRVWFERKKGNSSMITVDMGKPEFGLPSRKKASETGEIELELEGGISLKGSCVSMGNPHFVIFLQEREMYPTAKIGPLVESHPIFPQRTNVEFALVDAPNHITARVWERGVGETLSCGTGACACLAAASAMGLTGKNATVSLPGGDLDVQWSERGSVFLTGPVRHVYDGNTPD
ncbi:MAG: diaminopimelate epimerase [Actinomycetota bacterium]|nr:diaminopimelate epimerase [Actinomycetota bacterium]